jgi:hypothetical protein
LQKEVVAGSGLSSKIVVSNSVFLPYAKFLEEFLLLD